MTTTLLITHQNLIRSRFSFKMHADECKSSSPRSCLDPLSPDAVRTLISITCCCLWWLICRDRTADHEGRDFGLVLRTEHWAFDQLLDYFFSIRQCQLVPHSGTSHQQLQRHHYPSKSPKNVVFVSPRWCNYSRVSSLQAFLGTRSTATDDALNL